MDPSLNLIEAKEEGRSAGSVPAARDGMRGKRARRRSRGTTVAPPEWPVPPVRSKAARKIADWFGLPIRRFAKTAAPAWDVPEGLSLPEAGKILLITGPSGAGKSALLRELTSRSRNSFAGGCVLDVNRARLRCAPCVDQFGSDLALSLDRLNRVGLGEAYTYLRLPSELSDGQRWRLRLAVCLHRAMSLRPPRATNATHGERSTDRAGCR